MLTTQPISPRVFANNNPYSTTRPQHQQRGLTFQGGQSWRQPDVFELRPDFNRSDATVGLRTVDYWA